MDFNTLELRIIKSGLYCLLKYKDGISEKEEERIRSLIKRIKEQLGEENP